MITQLHDLGKSRKFEIGVRVRMLRGMASRYSELSGKTGTIVNSGMYWEVLPDEVIYSIGGVRLNIIYLEESEMDLL